MAVLTPAEILARTRQVYATCRTYQDQGVVETCFVPLEPGGREHAERIWFTTAFVRPDRFRFEYAETGPDEDDPAHMLVLWNEAGLRSWWTIQPGIRSYVSFREGIAQAAGVSDGSACLVPCLLLPGGRACDPLPPDGAAVLLRTEIEADLHCFVLRGRLEHGKERTLWIDGSNFLIRRVEEAHVFDEDSWQELLELAKGEMTRAGSEEDRELADKALRSLSRSEAPGRSETTFTFEPRLDAAVPAGQFATPGSWAP